MTRLVVLFAVLLKIQTVFAAQNKVSTAAYQAIVNESGFISSLKVGGCEVLGEPMQFCVGTNWGLERTERRNGDRELLVHLNSDRGKGQLLYQFEENRIAVSMTHYLGGFQSWQVRFSDEVIAVEDLQCRDVDGAEAIQYAERGQIRPTPLVPFARVQRLRLYLRNGATLLF